MKKYILFLIIMLVVSVTAQTWQLVNPLPAGRADDIAIGYTNMVVPNVFTLLTSFPGHLKARMAG